jgi:hypothetical protein
MEDLDPEDIADTTDRALRLNLMTAAGDVSELFVGRIAYEIRRAPSTEIVQDGDIHPVLVIAAQAFEEIAKGQLNRTSHSKSKNGPDEEYSGQSWRYHITPGKNATGLGGNAGATIPRQRPLPCQPTDQG